MKVVTEAELRDIYKKAPFTSFDLPSGMKLTPAASQFLSERKIQVLRDGVSESQLAQEDRRFNISAPTPAYPKVPPKPQPLANSPYQSGNNLVYSGIPVQPVAPTPPVTPVTPQSQVIEPKGSTVQNDTTAQNMDRSHVSNEKPEHMTHLRGAELVPKIHPIIAFRGQLDVFEAVVLNSIISAETSGFKDLAGDLNELLQYSRQIMRAEVRQEPLEPMLICGWGPAEIRERSHYPNKYYNVNHFTPQPEHGKVMAELNYLRAIVREMELSAEHAFYNEDGTTQRDDILEAVNRFSSLIYVFMLQLLAGVYKYGC
ncbi:MAG: hypothetical protein RSH79_00500 [Clostridiales bacterium]